MALGKITALCGNWSKEVWVALGSALEARMRTTWSSSFPFSDAGSLDSDESSRPLLEQGLEQAFGPHLTSPAVSLRGRLVGRDGPCEHCGIVHTARIPDVCLEATAKTETSDDESLLLC